MLVWLLSLGEMRSPASRRQPQPLRTRVSGSVIFNRLQPFGGFTLAMSRPSCPALAATMQHAILAGIHAHRNHRRSSTLVSRVLRLRSARPAISRWLSEGSSDWLFPTACLGDQPADEADEPVDLSIRRRAAWLGSRPPPAGLASAWAPGGWPETAVAAGLAAAGLSARPGQRRASGIAGRASKKLQPGRCSGPSLGAPGEFVEAIARRAAAEFDFARGRRGREEGPAGRCR